MCARMAAGQKKKRNVFQRVFVVLASNMGLPFSTHSDRGPEDHSGGTFGRR
jgi:hypothetical protein